MGAFASTPTFELFRRGLEPRIIKRFHGLNAYTPLTLLPPDWAQDILNVIVNGNGQLSKFRLPQQLSPSSGFATGPQLIFDFQQANGTRQIFTVIGTTLAYFTNDGTVGPIVVQAANPANANPWSFVETSNILIGVNGQKTVKWTGTDLLNVGIQIPLVAPTVNVVAGALSPSFGYEWAFSWKCSGNAPGLNGPSPIEVSTASPATAQIDGGGVSHSYQLTAIAPVPPDPQFDTLVWWRTIDGGGDLFRAAEVNINTGAVTFNGATVTVLGGLPYLQITDNTPDNKLDQTTRAPFLNSPPIQAKFAAVGQGRVILMNLVGAPQDAIYSGYERILIGNPPECFPPNNRLRLSIGAESIAGGGIIQAGVVMFSNTDKMYMLRGQLEDITDTAPVQFTQYLVELPWKLGCLCHQGIQATSYGLVWLAGDKTVQIFDGNSQPQDISSPVYPILRNITPGAEANCQSAYFNWLERDWYVLLVPYNGSLTPNRMIIWGLEKDTSQVDIFICTIPADGIGVVTSSQLQRRLLIGKTGQLFNLPVQSDTTGGISDLSLIPAQFGVVSGIINTTNIAVGVPAGNTSTVANVITPTVPAWAIVLENLFGANFFAFSAITPGMSAFPGHGGQVAQNLLVLGQGDFPAGAPINTSATSSFTAPGVSCGVLAAFPLTTGLIPVVTAISTSAPPGTVSAVSNTAVVAGVPLIVVIYGGYFSAVATINGFTDTNGNVYQFVGGTTAGFNGSYNCVASIFICANPVANAGGHNVTYSSNEVFSANSRTIFEVYQVTNIGPVITSAQLPAYWFGGYHGNDSSQRSEMFRWARLITDQNAAAFQMRFNLVDDDLNSISNPYQTPLVQLKSSKLAINRKAKRCAPLIQFPTQDVSANVMELQILSVPSADR